MDNCIFCSIPSLHRESLLAENESFYAVNDLRPVSRGHCLIISKQHFSDIFSLPPELAPKLLELVGKMKKKLDEEFHPDGYNVTANVGHAGGQTIFHVHVHVIPRYLGDSLHPEAGGPKTE